jgi:hypothetical protein
LSGAPCPPGRLPRPAQQHLAGAPHCIRIKEDALNSLEFMPLP